MTEPLQNQAQYRPSKEKVGSVLNTGLVASLRTRLKNPEALLSLCFLAVYVVIGIVLFLLLWTVAGYLLPASTPRIWENLIGRAVFAVAAIVPGYAVAKFQGHAFAEYGLPERSAFNKLFWAGALWGLIALSALLLAMYCLGDLSFAGIALHGIRIAKFAAFWGAFFLLVAFFEEFAFRGYPRFAISQIAGFWPAAIFSSVIFGYMHRGNPGETWVGALGATAIALFFCLTLRRTGTLWFAVGMHASWDWGESFLYSVPDSGAVVPGHLLNSAFHGPQWLTGGLSPCKEPENQPLSIRP